MPYLKFAGLAPHSIGASVVIFASSAEMLLQSGSNTNGILGGYAIYNGTDFATLTSGTVQAYSGYTTSNLGTLAASSSTTNFEPTGLQTSLTGAVTINSLNLVGATGVSNTAGYTITLAAGGLIANTAGSIRGGTLKGSPSGELTVYLAQDIAVSSTIADNGGATTLVISGPGTLTLTGSNTYTGNTWLNNGGLVLIPPVDATYAGAIHGPGNLTKSGTATLTLSGTSDFSGTTTITGGGFRVNNLLSPNSEVTLQSSAVLCGSGTVGGDVSVTGGSIAMSSSGSILGWVDVDSGTLTIGKSGTGSYLTTLGGLFVTGGGALVGTSSTSAIIVGNFAYSSSANSTYSGLITGGTSSLDLDSPTGTMLLLTQSNSFGGGTSIEGGTLKLANSSALSSGGVTMSGGTLDLGGLASAKLTSLSGSGGTVQTSSGTSTLLVVPPGGTSTAFAGSIINGGGQISLLVNGSGTLVLSGSSSYSGGTTVQSGTLVLESSTAVLDGSSLTVGNAAGSFCADCARFVAPILHHRRSFPSPNRHRSRFCWRLPLARPSLHSVQGLEESIVAKKKRSWLAKLIFPQPARRARPRVQGFRNCTIEQLETRSLLSGHTFLTLSQLLTNMTPNPQPSGDVPADMSQVQTLTTYTASALPPDMPGIPEIHDFVVGVTQVYNDIADNPAARPAFWVQTALAGNKCQVFLDDNGMLITQWTINWGDGTTPQTIGPAPWVVHNYSTAGDYTVTVTANGMDGTYTADGVDPPISPDAPMLHVAGPQKVAAGQTFSLDNLASVISQDAPTGLPEGATTDSTDFSYSIDWGDGSTPFSGISVDVIAPGGNGAPFLGALMSDAGDGPLAHVYTDSGVYNLNVTVTNNGSGLSDTQTIPVTVVQLAPTIMVGVSTITDYTCSEGGNVTFSAGGTVDASLTDSVAYLWTIADSSGDIVAQSTDPSPSFTFPSADTYSVSLVTAVDNIQSAPATATITANAVAPTIASLPDVTVAVGQPLNLSATFTDFNPNNTHTAAIDWGDGSTTDYGAQVTEESSDGVTTTPGTINDSYAYTTATSGTPNMVTVTLTNSEGASTPKSFAVTVVSAATVSLSSFSANSSGQLQVPYSITGGTAAPFTIDIYSSPDGTTPDQLLTTVTVDGTSSSLSGPDTATFSPSFDDIPSNYHLIAVTNGNSDSIQSTVEFSGGIFVAASETADPPQKILYVFGGASGDTVTIHGPGAGGGLANTVVLNSNSPFTIDNSITGIHVRGESGTDDIEVDSDVTLPLWLFGGSGTTTINDAGSGADVLAAGDGSTAITHSGSGDATISGGTASTTITSESGNDTINGGAGPTTITTGSGNDTVNVGTGETNLSEGNGQSSPEILDDSNGSHGGITNAYTESGSGWLSPSPTSGFNQGERVNDGSHPTATATWAFGNLDPTAYYDVYVTWSPIAGAATNAQYSVTDGGTSIQPIGVGSTPAYFNQNLSPSDYQAAGTIWRSLGVFQVTSGMLAVELTAGSSGMALADAAMIVPHVTLPLTNLSFGTTGDGIAVDENGNFAVTYTIDGEDSAPFSIGIYGSPDGVQPATLLQTYEVDDPTMLTGGGAVHTVSFAPDLSNAGSSQYLFAMLDCNQETYEMSRADNRSAALSGIFQNGDGGLVVLRGGSVNEGITITQDPSSGTTTLTINGTPQQFAGVTSIQVSATDGNDTVDASGVDLSVTIYAGAGSDNIIGGRGNNQLYGGAGSDILDGSNGQNNWIQAGPGGGTIRGGSGNDWLYGGGGTNNIIAGNGTEVVHGGSGTNYIHGGLGLDNLFGGTGPNYIYGNGGNDLLAGGSGNNYIQPNGLYPPYDLASVEVKDSNNAPTFDGNMNAAGQPSDGDDQAVDPAPSGWTVGQPTDPDPGYCGLWTFTDFDSGSRLGGSGTTPVAVYVTWDPANVPGGGLGIQWTENAVYTVSDSANSFTPFTTDPINQGAACTNNNSPEPGDRNWKLLGVWNVPVLDTITVTLTDGSYQTGDMLCVGDAMIHAIWPTVSIRADLDGTKTFGEKDDFLAASNPASISVEGGGSRLKLQMSASIESLYSDVANVTPLPGWYAVVPNVTGLLFWNSATATTAITPNGSGDIIDSAFESGGTGPYTGNYEAYIGTVIESVDPNGSLAGSSAVVATVAQATNTGLATVMAQVGAVQPGPQKDVFAFEGKGGFPAWFKEGEDYSISDKGFFNSTLSLPQVLEFWRPAAIAGASPGTITRTNPNGDVAWHYYSQAGVAAAERQILAIAKQNHGGVYDTITLLGYSNGGAAALEVASWLKTQGITVDLGITCDPVPKPVASDFVPGANSSWSTGGVMPIAVPANVTTWRNYYQNFDTDSLAAANLLNVPKNLGGLPRRIWGRYVNGATNIEVLPDTPVFRGGFVLIPASAHIYIPTSTIVTGEITTFISALPSWRKSYTYTAP